MKQFVSRVLIFAGLALLLLATALLILPNPAAKNNMLGALLDKHEILSKTRGPRIIIVGGSNVAYGLDSKRIQDELHIPVVNAGLHAGLGMKFYLSDVKRYIRQGDVVLVVPEYEQYYADTFYGNIELVTILFDVYRDGMGLIDAKQWWHLMRFIPFYAASKIKLSKSSSSSELIGVYDRKAFNSYGDAYVHWNMPGKKIVAKRKSKEEDLINPEAIESLISFQEYVKNKKARMFLLPPGYQSSSFANQKPMIDKIYQTIKNSGLSVIARPERYELPDSVFFDTNYHLIRPGIDKRSDLITEDLERVSQRALLESSGISFGR